MPVFLVLGLQSGDGRDTTANILILIAGASDYLDGLAARLTGQFSRIGALLDPLVDRLVVISAAIVIFHFELLPQYLMVLLFVRELLMLLLAIPALRLGLDIKINWIGRLAVWPVMVGGFVALCADSTIAEVLMGIGIVGAYAASYLYIKTMLPAVRGGSTQDLNQS